MLASAALNLELLSRFERWLESQRYAMQTTRLYIRTVKAFIRFMAKVAVTSANHFDVREFLVTEYRKGHIPYTLKYELHALRIFFDFLNMGGLVPWAAARFVKLRKIRPRVPHVLSQQQVRAVFDAAINPRERALVEMLYGTGARPGELVGILVEDVDFSEQRIRVTGKSGTRFVVFGTPASRALRSYLAGRTTGFLFTEGRPRQRICVYLSDSGGWRCRWKEYDDAGRVKGVRYSHVGFKKHLTKCAAIKRFQRIARSSNLQRPTGRRPLRADSISRAIRNIGARIGLKVTPYHLRHSYATHMLDRGADIRVIQELMGHGRLSTTQVYTHVSQSMLNETFLRCHPRSRNTKT